MKRVIVIVCLLLTFALGVPWIIAAASGIIQITIHSPKTAALVGVFDGSLHLSVYRTLPPPTSRSEQDRPFARVLIAVENQRERERNSLFDPFEQALLRQFNLPAPMFDWDYFPNRIGSSQALIIEARAPVWAIIALPAAIPAAAATIVLSRQIRRRRRGWCLHCGYDLQKIESSKCPECGTLRAPDGSSHAPDSRHSMPSWPLPAWAARVRRLNHIVLSTCIVTGFFVVALWGCSIKTNLMAASVVCPKWGVLLTGFRHRVFTYQFVARPPGPLLRILTERRLDEYLASDLEFCLEWFYEVAFVRRTNDRPDIADLSWFSWSWRPKDGPAYGTLERQIVCPIGLVAAVFWIYPLGVGIARFARRYRSARVQPSSE